jgi:hypothetical protein
MKKIDATDFDPFLSPDRLQSQLKFEKLLDTYRRRLYLLETQRAKLGMSADPSIIIEIEDIQVEIAKIEGVLSTETQLLFYDPHIDKIVPSLYASVDPLTIGAALPWEFLHNPFPRPPEFPRYMVWYLPREVRDEVIGDFEEGYCIIYREFGQRKAVIWYYYQVGASFYPFAVAKVQKLIKLGVFAWVGEAFRRFIS